MKKIFLVLLTSWLLFLCPLWPRENRVKIGELSWYTEQNSFREMIQIADRAGKPILAVFSASWCGPCQEVKKEVFSKPGFKKVDKEAVLLYIEQTEPKGMEYCRKYNVRAFPTFKMFSKGGIFLDNGHPDRTVDGFLQWIEEVKGGNNFYQLSKRLEKNPADREALLKIVDKLGWEEKAKKTDYLKKAVDLNPDPKDEITHQAYEKLAFFLAENLPVRKGPEKERYVKENGELFHRVIKAYYPDKFRYEFKGNQGFVYIVGWFNRTGEYGKGLDYFEDFLKKKKGKIDFSEDLGVFVPGIRAYLKGDKIKKASNWLTKIRDYVASHEDTARDRRFFFYYSGILQSFVEHHAEGGKKKEAEKYASLFYEEASRLKKERYLNYYKINNAKKYGLLARGALADIEKDLKKNRGMRLAAVTADKAVILAGLGEKEKARRCLVGLCEDKGYLDSINLKDIPMLFNNIAWTMVEAGIVDQKTLEIARKAADLKKVDYILDTLASVHAELGNFKEAVQIEKEALQIAKDENSKEEFRQKIDKWQKEVKE